MPKKRLMIGSRQAKASSAWMYLGIILGMVVIVAIFSQWMSQGSNDITGRVTGGFAHSNQHIYRDVPKAKPVLLSQNVERCEQRAEARARDVISWLSVARGVAQGQLEEFCATTPKEIHDREACYVFNSMFSQCLATGKVSHTNLNSEIRAYWHEKIPRGRR